jgi:hypothetical protein
LNSVNVYAVMKYEPMKIADRMPPISKRVPIVLNFLLLVEVIKPLISTFYLSYYVLFFRFRLISWLSASLSFDYSSSLCDSLFYFSFDSSCISGFEYYLFIRVNEEEAIESLKIFDYAFYYICFLLSICLYDDIRAFPLVLEVGS